ncbi:SbcC/MukB-like Walker B domain-containing protein [Natrinema salifodinae]|uniref:Putative exonuclease SbcCD, C subunit n=2 Tax=Halobacteriales TaxID=2235 RepID=A0A1I0PSJ4_9EURY|nr:SbcC/MukB-like Walker B domain-containing protein [Natrinema salifodinae]SEW17321.1 Putative exonuclease SbcCD, C subunit [Natrinema salifodinae]
MKISRLHIEKFARDEFPEFTKDDVSSDDLLIKGGNRSGKTLTFNALLYGLYGPQATFGVSPGRKSTVRFHFDDDDIVERGGGGRKYSHGDGTYEKGEADQKIEERIGPAELVTLQFLHSEKDELPLARLSGDDRLSVIRRVGDTDLQDEIEALREQREELEYEIERIQRTELQPRKEDLDDINIGQYERRLEKIEHLQSLIDSGRIETIKQRLLDNEEIREELNELTSRKRVVTQELRKKRRQLREAQRYTQQVNNIIVDAIQELTCAVCDQIVVEETAKQRLQNGRCPQCGRKRDLDELKSHLSSKVERADDDVEALETEIEELQEEKGQLEDEIESLQDSVPDLSDLNDLTQHTLEDNDYDIDAVAERTQVELDQHREHVEKLRERKDRLETEIVEVEATLADLDDELTATNDRIDELSQESFEEIIQSFRDAWSENYQAMAPELAVEIDIESDGTIILPGNEGAREYDELSTGEIWLLNLSFAYTLAEQATETEDAGHNWEILVLDEPFANIDEDIREETLEYIRDSDIQFIIMTSNEDLESHFNPQQVKSLDRIQVQYTFDDMEELIADD